MREKVKGKSWPEYCECGAFLYDPLQHNYDGLKVKWFRTFCRKCGKRIKLIGPDIQDFNFVQDQKYGDWIALLVWAPPVLYFLYLYLMRLAER